MGTTAFKGNPVKTSGTLPAVGSKTPAFSLTKSDLSEATLADFTGKKIILNIVPSLDTGICQMSMKRFNQEAAKLENTVILTISRDLPFAQKRFCEAEGIDQAIGLSEMRDRAFGEAYGAVMLDGPLGGLLSRAVVVVDEQGTVTYTEQVPEITQEPDYEKALAAVRG